MDIPLLQECVEYFPDTGKLVWKHRIGENHWNSLFAGKEAFCTDHGDAYLCGTFQGKQYLAHRVAWAVHTGNLPKVDVDRRDGNGRNNKFLNLREATKSLNSHNKAAPRKKSTLPTGVSLNRSGGGKPYRAQVGYGGRGKSISLGYFNTPEEASQAYLTKVRELGYSDRHGQQGDIK